MRLLQLHEGDGSLRLTKNFISDIPPYAILSHTWGAEGEEVTLMDITARKRKKKKGRKRVGYQKLRFCGKQAASDGLDFFWVDTCCIDKSNSTELQEAINSMFRWYQNASRCYVYLTDVSIDRDSNMDELASQAIWKSAFRKSRWWTRGWTLQELIAPSTVEFFSSEGQLLGNKESLEQLIHEITGIPSHAISGKSITEFSIPERMSWSEGRSTTREEDSAYALFGLFDIQLPMIYGEGKKSAFGRLKEAITKHHERVKPRRFKFSVSLGRNSRFVGRQNILTQIIEQIPPDFERHNCQRVAIEGLGGIGKTQLALEAAYCFHEKNPDCDIFWVPAVSGATFENAFRQIAQVLELPGATEVNVNVIKLVKDALSQNDVGPWLMIIDNADDLLISTAGQKLVLNDCIPFNHQGSILVTTRSHEVTVGLDISPRNTFVIESLSQGEALEMMRKHIQDHHMSNEECTSQLLDLLAHVPLAIRQASAYIEKMEITTKRYMECYLSSDKNRNRLLSHNFQDLSRYQGHANPTATTWLISFDQISKTHPMAAQYLQYICFLLEKDILPSLLPGDDDMDKDEALGILRGYAFISRRDGDGSFDIHRLVKLAMRNAMNEDRERDSITKLLIHLSEIYPPPGHTNRSEWLRYLPHAEAVLYAWLERADRNVEWQLVSKIGRSYQFLGKYSQAEEKLLLAFSAAEETLGSKDSRTLEIVNDLGTAFRSQGKFQEAERMYQRVLEERTERFGPTDPSTLSSMNNLALVFGNQGKYAEAEAILKTTHQMMCLANGSDHHETLSSLSNLALCLNSAGKHAEAEKVLRQTVEAKQRVLGPEHPSTLMSMNNLANVLVIQRKSKESTPIHQYLFELQGKTLSQRHPDFLSISNNLAVSLRHQGCLIEAKEMLLKILEHRRELLGEKHPYMLDSMNNLANVYGSMGEFSAAEQLHRQVRDLRRQALGPENPATLISMSNLALVLEIQGKFNEARLLYSQTSESRIKILGPDHPRTLDSQDRLAGVCESIDHQVGEPGQHTDLSRAPTLQVGQLEATVDCMNNLAGILNGRH